MGNSHTVTITITNDSLDELVDVRMDTDVYDFESRSVYTEYNESPEYVFGYDDVSEFTKQKTTNSYTVTLSYTKSLTCTRYRAIPLTLLWNSGVQEYITLWSKMSCELTKEVSFTPDSVITDPGDILWKDADCGILEARYKLHESTFCWDHHEFLKRQYYINALMIQKLQLEKHIITLKYEKSDGDKRELKMTLKSTIGDLQSLIEMKLTAAVQEKMSLNRFKEAMLMLNHLLQAALQKQDALGKNKANEQRVNAAHKAGLLQVSKTVNEENKAELGTFKKFEGKYNNAQDIMKVAEKHASGAQKQQIQQHIAAIDSKKEGNVHLDNGISRLNKAVHSVGITMKTLTAEHLKATARQCSLAKKDLRKAGKCFRRSTVHISSFCCQQATIAESVCIANNTEKRCRAMAIKQDSDKLKLNNIDKAEQGWHGGLILEIHEKVPDNLNMV